MEKILIMEGLYDEWTAFMRGILNDECSTERIDKIIEETSDEIGDDGVYIVIEISGADAWIRCLSEVIPSNRRVVAIQIDLEMEEGKDYKELFGYLSEQINVTGDFVCRGIDFTDDITERYYAK